MLALGDVLLCTVTVPKMLIIFWRGPYLSVFPACLTQMFFVHTLFLSESAVLLAMASDRHVAICVPLLYAALFTGSLTGKAGLALVVRSVTVFTPRVLLILQLHFCQSNIIHHNYCENMGIAQLACNSIALNSIYAHCCPTHHRPGLCPHFPLLLADLENSLATTIKRGLGKGLWNLWSSYMCHLVILYSGFLFLLYPSLWPPCTQTCPYSTGKPLFTAATYHGPHCLWNKDQKDKGASTRFPWPS